jgi:hypothetical protein
LWLGAQGLAQLNEELETDCAICFERPRSTRLEPCGHSNFCWPCVSSIELCPLCRVPVENLSSYVPAALPKGKSPTGGGQARKGNK